MSGRGTTLKNVLQRHTAVELVAISGPSLVGFTLGVLVLSWPSAVLGWALCGLLGLFIAVGSGRTSVVEYSLIEWPRSTTTQDIAVNAIAYNGVLVLGTLLVQFVFAASDSITIAAFAATVLPFWFLKHIRLFVYLDEM